MKELTSAQVIIRIITIIATVELLIMLVLVSTKPDLDLYLIAALDVISLTLLSSPLIYFWVIRPFVIARDNAVKTISQMAFNDPLTQLPNRRLIFQLLEKLIATCVRHKTVGALLLLDLDGFKPVNDTYGHDAGDAVLKKVAKRLQANIRAEDIAGRLGGDEFVVLFTQIADNEQSAHQKAVDIALKLQNEINKSFDFKGNILQVNSSIGICLLGSEKIDVESAIKKADTAMYRAKQAGKGRIALLEELSTDNNPAQPVVTPTAVNY